MVSILTPDWFLGFDVLIEVFSFIVLAIFCALSIKNYRIDREKKSFLYVGVGFGLIALAQIATILTKTTLYYDFGIDQQIGNAIVTNQIVNSVDIFYHTGFFFYRFLTLMGLYIIYRLHNIRTYLADILVFGYFVLLSILASTEIYYFFHLTALALLVLITRNYYGVYGKNKFTNTAILVTSFGILALSQLLFIFSQETIQASANIAELISYMLLLFLAIKIRKDGKKKKSDGDNIRHVAGNYAKRRKY